MIATLELCITFGNGTPGKSLALPVCQGVGLTSSLFTAKQFPLTPVNRSPDAWLPVLELA